jgi:hypothetical protein
MSNLQASPATCRTSKLSRLGRLEAIEHVRDLLALVEGESSDVNQRLYSFGTRKRYDGTGVGASCHYDWPFGPVQAAVKGSHIGGKRCQ